MRLMITGGGTGGHTSPAVATIQEVRKREPDAAITWVGCPGSMEERVSASAGVPFLAVPVEGWPRGSHVRKIWAAGKLAAGIAMSALHIARFKPDVVFGVGGYVSLPLGWAAQRMGVATVLHEQNKRLGMANRILAPRASRMILSYPDTIGNYPRDRARVLGNPVRAGFANPPSQSEARTSMNLDPDLPTILVCGGSQGAHTLNQAVREALPSFEPSGLQLIWMTGKADAEEARTAAAKARIPIKVYAFIDDMVSACAASSLIVSRSGASTTAEVAILGKPTILVPYPRATDNHQEANARAFEEAGAAVLLLDSECTGACLGGKIKELLADPARLAAMSTATASLARPGAAREIVDEIVAVR